MKMKLKKGLKEVKEMLSPHHHHHHHPHEHGHGPRCHDRDGRDGGGQRRKSGPPSESRRGPLAPVLDRLEKDKSVPIHLHISRAGSFSITRKASSSSYSTSDIAPDDSNSLADIHQHIQAEEEKRQEQQPIEPEPPKPEPQPEIEMEVPEPFIAPPSPPSLERSDVGEETLDPFLVDDPEDPLSDPGSPPPAPALVPPLDPISLPIEVPPPEPVVLSPAAPSELPLPPVPASPVIDKPVPPLPARSDTESEPEAPAVHLPQLVLPTMFLPIPNVRISSHLTWWLTRRTPTYY